VNPLPDYPSEMSGLVDDVDAELREHFFLARQALLQGPSPEVASAHLVAITEAAHLLASTPDARPTASRSRARGGHEGVRTKMRRLALGVAIAAIVGVVSTAGLAVAGVGLPSVAVTAFDKHGLSLPTQATADHSSQAPSLPDASQHGQDVKAVATDGTTGCEQGQAVSAVANSKQQAAHAGTHAQNAANAADPCTQGDSSTESGASSATTSGAGWQATNPTGYGKDSHPTDGTSGQATNPTGVGKDNHPTDGASGQATNPTGYGKDNHPGP
jgi:hypothetical protein